MPTSLVDHVTAEIRAELARQRVPQKRIAEALGISEASVSERMLGRVALDLRELETIGALLGKDPQSFFPAGVAA